MIPRPGTMVDIHYTNATTDESYLIDERSQRLLVYLHLHDGAFAEDAKGPVGVSEEAQIQILIDERLGPQAAGLVEKSANTQRTLSGEQQVQQYNLTADGQDFVYDHLSALSMPADVGELAKKVAELQVEHEELRELEEMVFEIDSRIKELEDRI